MEGGGVDTECWESGVEFVVAATTPAGDKADV